MAVELFVPIVALVMMVVALGLLTRLVATGMLNKTIREALRSHPDSVPMLAARIEARQPWADALLGWIMIAIAVGLVLLSLFEGFEERRAMMQAAIVPAIIGITVLLYLRIARPRHAADKN